MHSKELLTGIVIIWNAAVSSRVEFRATTKKGKRRNKTIEMLQADRLKLKGGLSENRLVEAMQTELLPWE